MKKNNLNEKTLKQRDFISSSEAINESTINYVTPSKNKKVNDKHPIKSIGDRTFHHEFEWKSSDTFPTFFGENNMVSIPKGVKRQIQRLPKRVLSDIDEDKNIAIEKCLVIASNLTSTLYLGDNDYWKSLSSSVLQKQVKKGNGNTFIYKGVVEALKYFTNATQPIIETKKNSYGYDTYEKGVISKQYKFSAKYITKNLDYYQLQYTDCIQARRRYLHLLYAKACKNIIGINLIEVYSKIIIPTHDEILCEGRRLVKQGYRTKKGKVLTILNKKSKNYYSDWKNRSFVEDNLLQYNYLTSRGYMIPIIGAKKSGGRVVDSFNLMPSWIRSLCKIDNEEIVEVDFIALHPNIAVALFKGSSKYLTHLQVAEKLNKPLNEVKIEHLSFFNKHPNDMAKSPLYQYYRIGEPTMLDLIIKDKRNNGYKNTSKELFKKEVEVMTTCINALNSLNIYVLYVYDALYCKKSDLSIVKEIMNKSALEHKVFTTVK